MKEIKIYTCSTFTGHYQVGTAAVVQAQDQKQACEMLNAKLRAEGLAGDADPEDMEEFPTNQYDEVRILCDGDY